MKNVKVTVTLIRFVKDEVFGKGVRIHLGEAGVFDVLRKDYENILKTFGITSLRGKEVILECVYCHKIYCPQTIEMDGVKVNTNILCPYIQILSRKIKRESSRKCK